ncbi:hypothetical protein G9A89_015585 [Geosiphon pyriformis]|nr:hypothetical protein G9A89_015585 [Geosiphon pyriformis]
MILKLYDWEGTLTNTRPIALIKTAWKILSKILFNRISSACNKFDVLHDDNFSVLKETSTQTPIFAVGLIVKDTLKKNRELWLVFQDMQKGLTKIKMCLRFIKFFGSIYNGHINQIFYDSLLCKVKKHEKLYEYRLDLKFFTKSGRQDPKGGQTSFLAAGVFNILDIVSEFFQVNDISINTDKTVVIPINQKVECSQLQISGSNILIAKKNKSHRYLGIFLSMNGFFKSSLNKTHLDIRFFMNIVLRKAVLDKPFLYLVSVILQPIVYYRIQFTYVLLDVCKKWDRLLRKSLKLKANLSRDFPNEALYYSEFYSLKSFGQVQAECLLANLGYRSIDHQLDAWQPLSFPVILSINSTNCFLADMTNILVSCGSFLINNISNVFQSGISVSVVDVLGVEGYLSVVKLLQKFGIVFVNQLLNCHSKRLDPRDCIPDWFVSTVKFIEDSGLIGGDAVDCCSALSGFLYNFEFANDRLIQFGSGIIDIYTDGLVKSLGFMCACDCAAVYFPCVNLNVGVRVCGLLFSTLTELQTIVLILDCIPDLSFVVLYTDS